MLKSGLLRAVVHLPKGVFPQAGAAMSMWVLARDPRNRNSGDLLLVDSARLTENSRGVRDLRPTVATALASAVAQWLDGDVWNPPQDVEGTVRSVQRVVSMRADLHYGLDTSAPAELRGIAMATPDAVGAAERVQEGVNALQEGLPTCPVSRR